MAKQQTPPSDPSIDSLMELLSSAPTAWHATEWLKSQLEAAGFQGLHEQDAWELKPSGSYYVTRNGSSLLAFVMPSKNLESVMLVGSHTDSPALRIKPNGQYVKNSHLLLSSEVYGGPTLSSWFNRELGVAGRVVAEDRKGFLSTHLVFLDTPIAIIPHLAIHLDSKLSDEHKLNKQDHLPALAAIGMDEDPENPLPLHRWIEKKYALKSLLSSELFLVPVTPPSKAGLYQDLISSYRLDNLLSLHASTTALLSALDPHPRCLKVLGSWDNEEIGSETAQGAASTFTQDLFERICESFSLTRSDWVRARQRSLFLSVDVSHAFHPNHADKYDAQHHNMLGKGPVVKVNAAQHYANCAHSLAHISLIAKHQEIPLQTYSHRSDGRSGSTVGPIVATRLGIRSLDLGSPILSMHAARELASIKDHHLLCTLLTRVFQEGT